MAKKVTQAELNFFDIAYSLAGASGVDHVYQLISQINLELLTVQEKLVLEKIQESYKQNAQYPSWSYLSTTFGIRSEAPLRNVADLNIAIKDLQKLRALEYAKAAASDAIITADSTQDLATKIREAATKFKSASLETSIKPVGSVLDFFEYQEKAPPGIRLGIDFIDELTAGFQPGTVASIAGFTSQGKSTVANNCAYLNALLGKKVAIISLEMTSLICKYILLSRHSFEMKYSIPYQNLIRGTLSAEAREKLFTEIEPDYLQRVAPNLVILGTEDIPGWTEEALAGLYTILEEVLGGLDLIIWDHVNQFSYVNAGYGITGNHIIKYIADVTKAYKTKKGSQPVSLLVVQCNRDGYYYASRHDGAYELNALSDFNEIERTCTYVNFIYADEMLRAQNTAKLQLKKHRLGGVMLAPETTDAKFECSVVSLAFNDVVAKLKPGQIASIGYASAFGSNSMESNYNFDSNNAVVEETKTVRPEIKEVSTDSYDKKKSTNNNNTLTPQGENPLDFSF